MIHARGLGYRFPGGERPAVQGVDLQIAAGELCLLTGPTGCGKSTLLRLLAGLLQRHGGGEVQGEASVAGVDPGRCPPRERVRRIGFVGQEPTHQLIASSLEDEVAFAMESAGMQPEAMRQRVPELLRRVGLELDLDRDPRTLSGGQGQRLVVAAALSAGAPVLLLDEPLAMLDPQGAGELIAALRQLADAGTTVLLVEHRVGACWEALDRVLVMDEGRLVAHGGRAELDPGGAVLMTLAELGIRAPGAPLLPLLDASPPQGPPLRSFPDLSWTYPGAAQAALAPLSIELRSGARLAVLGSNGSGKSTLLRRIAACGDRSIVAVPQDPDLSLFCSSVREELAYGPAERRSREVEATVRRVAGALSIVELLDRPPQALSRGQRLRVAVAAALACGPRILLLDEPTAGQDHEQVEAMMLAMCRELQDGALIFATHDLELARRFGNQAILLREGVCEARGTPDEVLGRFSDSRGSR